MALRTFWQARKRQIYLVVIAAALALWAVVFVRMRAAAQVQRHIDAGADYVRRGQPGAAEREWREAAKLDPRNATVWDLLSELYIETEQWSKGSDALRQLQRAAPNRPHLYARMAACALRTGNEVEAKRLAELELKRDPADEPSLAMMAFLSSMQDDSDQQIVYLQRLLARSPNDTDTLTDLVQAYGGAGRYVELLPIADRLIKLKPDDAYGYGMRGAATFETDASPSAAARAEADLTRALSLSPLSPFVRFTLGRLYMRQGEFAKAIFQLELAEKLNPQKMDIPFALATAYARAGQPAKAAAARQRFEALRQEETRINVLKKRCALETGNVSIHLELGQLMMKYGEDRQALYYLQHAATLDPRNAEVGQSLSALEARLKSEPAPSAR